MNSRNRPFANLPYKGYAYVMSLLSWIVAIILLNIILAFFIFFFGNMELVIFFVIQLFFVEQSYFVAQDTFHSVYGIEHNSEWDCLKDDTAVEDVEALFFSACSTLIDKCYSKEEIIDMINTQY